MMRDKYDPKLTDDMVKWLRSEHESDEMILKGAVMLLRVNRNRGLYERIVRQPKRGLKKLEYELRKHVNMRLDGYTIEDVEKLDSEITPQIEAAISSEKIDDDADTGDAPSGEETSNAATVITGKRPDHDQLPEEIQAIWVKNAERWHKIKETYNLLLTLNAPCDRYEYLKLLKDAWYNYKADMARYDDFRGTMDEMVTVVKGGQLTEDDQRDIDVAQSYISRNLPVLQELVLESREPDFPEDKIAKLENLRSKIQARVTSLLMLNVMLSDQRKADLMKCDISLELPEDNAEGEKSE